MGWRDHLLIELGIAILFFFGIATPLLCCLHLTLTLTRTKNAKFQDVTKERLTINTGTTLVGLCTSTTVMLFDPCLQDYFWNYDNHGLKLLQLRFYAASAGGGG